MKLKLRTKLGLTIATAAGVLAVASFAFGAIPDGSGEIHGCYDKQSGALRVTDTQTNLPKSCGAKELPLQWAMRGIQGLPGPAGPQGPAGEPGADPVADAHVALFGTDTGNASPSFSVPCTLGEVLLTASVNHTAGGVAAMGQLLPISQNQALFALLGTSYGGNGQTTFALPDLRAITPNHMTYSICIQGVWPS